MSDLLSWIPLESGRDLGWTLIQFLWQGLLLAGLLNTVLPICRSAIARHNCALATLVLMASAPIATFLLLHDSGKSGTAGFTAAGTLAPALIAAPWIDWLV